MKLTPLLIPVCSFGLATALLAHEGEHQKLMAPDGAANDQFGRSVALSGETVVVGAPNHGGTGAAYVFVLDELTETWVFEQKLVASNGASDDQFGFSVAISNDLVVVGAPGADGLGNGAGAAYTFTRSGTVWTEEAVLQASDGGFGDRFGWSVGASGGTALVGARQGFFGNNGPGAAYVYVQSGSSWSEQQKLTGSPSKNLDAFGSAVAIVNNTAVVGAPRATGSSFTSGAAYMFTRSGSTWTQAQQLVPAGGSNGDAFGFAVDLFQQAVVVGATGDDDAANDAGAAYKFAKSGSLWAQTQKIVPITGQAGDRFGSAVARSYRNIIVGVPLDDEPTFNQGSTRIFGEAGGGQVYGEIFVAIQPGEDDGLGISIDIDQCWFVAGGYLNDELAPDAGAAYLFETSAPTAQVLNGSGINPLCLMSIEPPALGGSWDIQVDASQHPTTTETWVFCRQLALSTPEPWLSWEILVNFGSPLIFNSAMVGGGIAVHSVPIPASPSLLGYQVTAQAALFSGGSIIAICNAERVRIGCHHEE